MAKSGIRKGKDFVKNMEKLKKIYGGKIPKNLTLEEADKTLKKVTPIKKKSGGTAKKKKKDPIVSKFKRVRDTILLAPEAVEIGKDILQNLPMSEGGMKKLKSKKASEMKAAPAKKASQMQAAPAKKASEMKAAPSKKASELPVPDSNKGLKPIPPENKGLKKLPTRVRNRMGYMKKGGKAKVSKLGSDVDPMIMLNKMLDKKIPPLSRKEKIKLKGMDIKDKAKKVIKYGGYKKGGSIKAPCKLGRNKPTKLL